MILISSYDTIGWVEFKALNEALGHHPIQLDSGWEYHRDYPTLKQGLRNPRIKGRGQRWKQRK